MKKYMQLVLAGVLVSVVAAGCASTGKARKVKESGFQPAQNYALMKKTKGDIAQLLYVNPKVNWKKYDKVMIDPVTIWRVPGSKMADIPEDQLQQIGAFFHDTLSAELGKDYKIVTKAEPGTMKIRAALTEATKSQVALNMITTVVPIGLAVSYAKDIATGTHSFVGSAAAEMELIDATTGELLAAGVAARVGEKTIASSKLSSWGDVKAAAEKWSANTRAKLAQARSGTIEIEYE
jgi:hypothetical protein